MQQITRGDYLKDLITIFIENNLQTDITELYSQFIFQCGEIQKVLTPAQVIKISFDEIESQLLKSTNTCYLAGITTDGHKETFNGSLTFNTRGEVVYYEPPVSTVIPAATETNCDCRGLRGFFSNCTQPAIKAYFSLNYVPTKLSELTNDTDFQDSVDVAESIAEHNASDEAHPYIQSVIASTTEVLEVSIADEAGLREQADNTLQANIDAETSLRVAATETLQGSINAETTAREEAVSLAISTTKAYADSIVTQATEATKAYADSIVSAATTATEAYTNSVLQSATTAINTTIGDLSQLDTSVKSSVTNAINAEVSARQGADNNLQGQIDALAAASDVTDIVGTYAELQAYDTQHLNNNDIIKVLSDETHDDEPSYYRFNKTAGTFSYIGSESAAYTKAQADAKFVTQTTTINGEALSQNITLTATEVGALPSDTTINDLTTTAQQNALNSGVTSAVVSQVATNTTNIASNTSAISTINGKIPTDASSSNKLVSASTLSASIADFANQDLSNLTSNGEGRLHALKAYADNGELLTDPDGLAFVEKYAHSTFDLSKFTVVGSPLVTSDGIASGFSSSNYIYTAECGLSTANSFVITFPVKALSSAPTTNKILWGLGTTSPDYFYFYDTANSNQYTVRGINNSTVTLTPNSDYIFKWIRQNNADTLLYKNVNDNNFTTIVNAQAATTSVTSNKLKIGNWDAGNDSNYVWQGSIDLKQLSITVNGVPVFSGNKTGIDTIKPVDFTAITSGQDSPFENPDLPFSDSGLIISADGVASGLSTSNYLKLYESFAPTSGQTWKITCAGKASQITSSGTTIVECINNSNAEGIWIALRNNGSGNYINLQLRRNSDNYDIVSEYLTSYGTVSLDQMYYFILEFTGTQYILKVSTDGENYAVAKTVNSSDVIKGGTFYTGIRLLTNVSDGGSIDLNAFKIYVDGNLVYQPCLKIPYTESKTGSKIVDAIYRDRVNDMAEQFGYAPYYTLSDTDFTLPQVELYGLIGQRTLRDSYRNGINYWELYSNRDLEQGGSCTSGVEVTFARPFADTNYVLSVPYSAKSSTAFTPTQTGDWIAKGKGLL